jgi:peptide/nickel transport system permease protein
VRDERQSALQQFVSRTLHSVAVVIVAASVAFLLLHFAPGDPISSLGDSANVLPEQRAQWRAQRGYDQPIVVQYGRWLLNIATGNFGQSAWLQRPVRDVLVDYLPNTIVLMSLALLASVVFGSAIGAWQASRANSRSDRAISFTTLVLYSIPEFWLALVLAYVFAYLLGVLPASGTISVGTYDSMPPWQQLIDRARHLVLPWTSLTLIGTAIFARYQRSAMYEQLREPYVRTARAKGVRSPGVYRHAWRNAVLPVVTILGLLLPALVTGAVFVENIFGWNGMGYVLLEAINRRDYELVSAIVILGSALTAVGSLLADTLRALLDPRLRVT